MRPSGDPSSSTPASSSSGVSSALQNPTCPDVRVLRVSQIDAGRLDVELTSLLREQFLKIFGRTQPPGSVARAAPELNLLLDLLLFYFTVWKNKPTPGMALMNLRYRDERPFRLVGVTGKSGMDGHQLSTPQRLAGLCAFVSTKYAWAKLTRLTMQGNHEEQTSTWRHKAWKVMSCMELSHGVASLLNQLAFLENGKYVSIWERAARARLVYAAPNTQRVVSFDYLNRQLVWQELSSLALFVLPIVAGHARRWRDGDGANGSRGWIASLNSSTNDDSNNNSTSTSTSNATTTPQYVSIETPCVACASVPCVNPFRLLPCGHVHCYYCAAARVAKSGDDSFRCADCGAKATGMRRSAFRKAEG
jgi:peroxin-2